MYDPTLQIFPYYRSYPIQLMIELNVVILVLTTQVGSIATKNCYLLTPSIALTLLAIDDATEVVDVFIDFYNSRMHMGQSFVHFIYHCTH